MADDPIAKAQATADEALKTAQTADSKVEEARHALLRARGYVDEHDDTLAQQIASLRAELNKANSAIRRIDSQLQQLLKKK